MGPADTNAPAGTGIPAPTKGLGAAELATESNDPAVLRELLDRARERLAFYESFDRIIGENIRRSGELMVETVALREQAQAQAAEFAAERAAFDVARQADREKYRQLVQTALNDVAATRPVIDQLVERLQEALVAFGEEAPVQAADETLSAAEPAAVTPEPAPLPEPVLDAPAPGEIFTPEPPLEPETMAEAAEEVEAAPEAPAEEPAPEPAPAGRRTVEVLTHGVSTAAIAISLQRVLRDLEHVSTVEAREFANGVLRLQVEAEGAIGRADIAEWLAKHEGTIANAADHVLEINLGSTPAT